MLSENFICFSINDRLRFVPPGIILFSAASTEPSINFIASNLISAQTSDPLHISSK